MWCWGWYLSVGKVMVLGFILDSRPKIKIFIALNTPANIGKTTLSDFVFLPEKQNLKKAVLPKKDADLAFHLYIMGRNGKSYFEI
jgi:hypothetical protein